MIRTHLALAALLLTFAAAQAAPEARGTGPAIDSIGVLYDVDAPFGARGRSLSLIRLDGDGFVYETYSRGLGLARLFIASDALESSRFLVDGEGRVLPRGYLCRSCDGRKDGMVEIAYDRNANLASYNDNDESLEFPLDEQAMDRKAWEIQTMLDIAGGRAMDIEPTLEGGQLKLYQGEKLGEETLATRAGELQTVKYRRQREGSENFQYLWYARELGWLPARWEIWRGDKRTIIIEAYEFAWGEDAALAMQADWLK